MAKVSACYKSNVFTKTAAGKADERQKVEKKPYTIPDEEKRRLLAKLILEEAVETVAALGFSIAASVGDSGEWGNRADGSRGVRIEIGQPWRNPVGLESIIDGAVDTIYVATGVLAAMNVPDLPHVQEVCRANDAKFPKGKATVDATGKYLKPPGWKAPDHIKVKGKVLAKLKKKGK